MTVNSIAPLVEYVEDGVTTAHAIPFRFLADNNLIVERRDGSTVTTLVLGTDYTVSGAGDPAGGTLTKASGGTSGAVLRIRRSTPRTQPMDYTAHDTFPAESHEGALDRVTLIAQEAFAVLVRALTLPIGEAGASLPTIAARIGKFLGFDADGKPVALSGTGADAALRDDLADDTAGDSLVASDTGESVRTRLKGLFQPATLERFVDAGAGSDLAGDGTSLNPYRTIQKAYDSLPRLLERQATIWLEDGTHNENYLDGSSDKALFPRQAVLFARGRALLTRTQNNAGAMSGAVVIRSVSGNKADCVIETSATLTYGIYLEAAQMAMQGVTVRAGANAVALAVAHRDGAYLHPYDCDFKGNGFTAEYGIYAETGGTVELTGLTSNVDGCLVGLGVFHKSLIDVAGGATVTNCAIGASVIAGLLSLQADVAGTTVIAASNIKGIVGAGAHITLRGASDAVPVRVASTIELSNAPMDATFALLSGLISAKGASIFLDNSDWSRQLSAANCDVYLRDANSYIAPATASVDTIPLLLSGGSQVAKEGTCEIKGSGGGGAQRPFTTWVPTANGETLYPELGVKTAFLTGNGSAFTGCTIGKADAVGRPTAIEGDTLHVIGPTSSSSGVELVTSATLILPAAITLGGAVGQYSGATFMFTSGSWKLVALGKAW